MIKNVNTSKFFLGANTPVGFYSLFDNLYFPDEDWFCYIIKGGPGTGKSGLMKRVAKVAESKNVKTELIYCSSDPDSLDAVIFPEKRVCIADGTSPHSIDPIYPGAADTIINLSDCWNSDVLYKNKEDIILLTKKNTNYHFRSKLYLQAYGKIYNDTAEIVRESMDREKLKNYEKRLSKKIFSKSKSEDGKEKVYFISGITPKGIVFFEETLNNYKTIYNINDEYGIVSSHILENVRYNAIKHGYDIIICFSPLGPTDRIECILIPDLDTAFIVSNGLFSLDGVNVNKKINTRRFLDVKKFYANRQKVKFNKKILNELLKEAVKNLSKAKTVHDSLEELYIHSMDFQKVNKLADDVISRIF